MNKPVIIGDCQLYLGDCREILPEIGAGTVDAVVTDPPYGHNNNNGDLIHRRECALGKQKYIEESRRIANDGVEANEILRQILPEMLRVMSPGCCCCCCCGGGPDPQFARWSLWLDEVFDFKQMVVWDKGPMGMGWHYRRSYETVLVGQVPGDKCRWFDKTDQIENIIRPGYRGIKKIIPSKDDHPTPKPVELAKHFIRLHTEAGHIVCDPFMGRGWVGLACIELSRKFIGIELDEEHFDYAIAKVEKAYVEQQFELPLGAKKEKIKSALW